MSFKKKLTIITLAILISIVTLSNVHAWVEPTTIPPGNNIFAPINSSAFGQSKIGGLILNIGNAAHGLIVKSGLVGIGTDDPQATLDVVGKVRSTGLEVNSTTEGVLFPRMTTAERDAIANKVEGLLIYNTDSNSKQLEIYTDGAWKPIGSGGDSLPIGTIIPFNNLTCPTGWTIADGTNGAPDLRGKFIRGLDSRTVSSGGSDSDGPRILGSSQEDAFQGHWHNVQYQYNPSGSRYADGGNSATGNIDGNGDFSDLSLLYSRYYGRYYATGILPDLVNKYSTPRIANETRPKNVALIYCMKVIAGNSQISSSSSEGSTTINSNYWQKDGTNIYYNDGNVGVGTTSVPFKFTVLGGPSQFGNTANGAGIRLQSIIDGSGKNYGEIVGINQNNNTFNPLQITTSTDGKPSLYLATNGNVGVGTSTPTVKMEVAGNFKATGVCIGSDCRASWPVHSYWVYNVASDYCATVGAYDLVSIQPNGVVNYLNPYCYCGPGSPYLYTERYIYGGMKTCAATCMPGCW